MNDQPQAPKGFFDGSPKMIFIFGLVSGIAAMSLLGGDIQLPSATKADTGTTVTAPTTAPTTAPVAKGAMPAITSKDHVRGDLKKAKVVMVEYGDFQCPFCARHHPTMQAISEKYGDDIAWVFRHYPLSFHPNGQPSALASECASDQGKFWEFADVMFEKQSEMNAAGTLPTSFYTAIAKDLGLNTSKFDTCMTDKKFQSIVDADQAGGNTAGVSGTPATFLNGTMVTSSSGNSVGAAPQATFDAIIDGLLKK